ncbi:response regulator [Sphingosinicella sp. BN140058]|uniref:response regulator n=1 Tax=Sphingosinicella sp. BN140058 TaxID=1892855 RepID=UPI001012812B|nr:response regulator [Sphingosinicella sp. BN140058]QAY75167.1 response regulator [Sphingosinicella sp. BN140058]
MTSAADDIFLVIAPSGRDAKVVGDLLGSAGLLWQADNDGEALLDALAEGKCAGAVVTDDALSRIDSERLRDAIERQPPWSDFPFVLLSRRGDTRQGSRSIEDLVNVTILERPLHPASLISAARAALRGRKRQRLAARHLSDLEIAQAQLRELAGSLEAKVIERTRDLAAANDRLTAEIAERERAEARLLQAQKMEAVGQLTGGIAHDFNNLLTAIVGSLDLLLRRTDDEKLRRLARNALEAGERGARLTGQLLAFSRRQRLSPTPVQPNDIISGMGDLLARSIGPHVRVETRLDANLWQALADPTQLEVMILNLAINARDAMPSGGRLTIATANLEHVPASLQAELPDGEYVAISVADTGTGMSPAVLARAFEPFFTTKEVGKGTGLGLAQLYGFAKQSGGTARIESREGHGTVVTIYLPRTREQTEAEAPRPLAARPATRARILVVDDDDDVRLVAAAMVEELGYEVVAEACGDAALKRLDQQEFALLLTDVAMPGMNGVDLAARAAQIRPDLPILFASGYADIQTFGEELSDDRLLKKPYRIADVAARISAILTPQQSTGKVVPLRRP